MLTITNPLHSKCCASSQQAGSLLTVSNVTHIYHLWLMSDKSMETLVTSGKVGGQTATERFPLVIRTCTSLPSTIAASDTQLAPQRRGD